MVLILDILRAAPALGAPLGPPVHLIGVNGGWTLSLDSLGFIMKSWLVLFQEDPASFQNLGGSALAMASLLDALAHNQAVLAPAFAILQPEGFVFHLVDDSRWFTDPQACMGALLEYGEGVSDGSVWGSERWEDTPLREFSHLALEQWAELNAQFIYSELGFQDSFKHIITLLNNWTENILQEETVVSAMQEAGLVLANAQSCTHNIAGYFTDGGVKHDFTAGGFEIVINGVSNTPQSVSQLLGGDNVFYHSVHFKVFPAGDWPQQYWAPVVVDPLPSLLNAFANMTGVQEVVNAWAGGAWGCTYEIITHAQANELLASWNLSTGGWARVEPGLWNVEFLVNNQTIPIRGDFDIETPNALDFDEISVPLIRGFASNFREIIPQNNS